MQTTQSPTLYSPTPLLGLAGYSGSGKTTLLERLLPWLERQGLRVAVIKHSHHDVDPDTPGKDSYRLRRAGSRQLLLATPQRAILFDEHPGVDDLPRLVGLLNHAALDLVLVEGFRDAPISKIEIRRRGQQRPSLGRGDPACLACATDAPRPGQQPPELDLNAPEAVGEFILAWRAQVLSGGLYPRRP
jgi:molybdopterin-guanine dinucleotide biosynthesis protein B